MINQPGEENVDY